MYPPPGRAATTPPFWPVVRVDVVGAEVSFVVDMQNSQLAVTHVSDALRPAVHGASEVHPPE